MAQPLLYLVGNHEIGVLLGNLSRQRTYQITRRRGFPEPVAELAQGKVWLGHQVEAWIAANRGQSAPTGAARDSSPPASPDD